MRDWIFTSVIARQTHYFLFVALTFSDLINGVNWIFRICMHRICLSRQRIDDSASIRCIELYGCQAEQASQTTAWGQWGHGLTSCQEGPGPWGIAVQPRPSTQSLPPSFRSPVPAAEMNRCRCVLAFVVHECSQVRGRRASCRPIYM